MSNYTEADVERDAGLADGMKDGWPEWATYRQRGVEAVARLKAAALEGAKVPGLQLKVMELDTRVRHAETLADEVAVLVRRKVIDSRDPAADALLDFRDPPSTPRADRMAELEREVSALQARLNELNSEAQTINVMHDAEKERADALQARVADLTSERDAARGAITGWKKIKDRLMAERDALRAQVERVQSLLCSECGPVVRSALSAPPASAKTCEVCATLRAQVKAARDMANEMKGGTFSWPVHLLEAMDRAALSAPPAETTRNLNDCGKPSFLEGSEGAPCTFARQHDGGCSWNPPAETTPHDPDDACGDCGKPEGEHRDGGAAETCSARAEIDHEPAETTPAPERAEALCDPPDLTDDPEQ